MAGAEIPLWALDDIEELRELVGRVRLLTDRYQHALVTTLNRTAAGARTDAVVMVREGYNLLPADQRRARKRFRIRRATFRTPVATLYARDSHGVHVSERQPFAALDGIRYSALHHRALVSHGRTAVFIARGIKSRKLIVFRRRPGLETGKRGRSVPRRDVKAVYTASELDFLAGSGRAELLTKTRARLGKEAKSQLDYQLRRIFDKKWGVKRSKA